VFLIRMGISILAMTAFIFGTSLVLMWMERKVVAHIQVRLGPMRVGFHGTLQPIADALKMLAKEAYIPGRVDQYIYRAAPYFIFIPTFMILVTIPFAPHIVVRELSIGIFYIISILAMTTVGIMMAGWSSYNKYSLLGAVRSVGQLISYELPIGLSTICVVMLAGSLKLSDIVTSQKVLLGIPLPYIILQPLGFMIFMVGILAELCRIPFDLPEAESELVAGYHTEYSGLRFGLILIAEYFNMFSLCGIAVLLFLGGWNGPLLPPIVWFLIKTYFLLFALMWIRGTLPRVRPDQLMDIGWKFLLPASLINVGLTGILVMLWR